ncbi:hypothetical protein D3C76_736850 [compost metagenome]
MAVEEAFDLRLPRVAVQHVGELRWKRIQPGLAHEGFQCRTRRAAAGDTVRVLLRQWADGGYREGQWWCRQGRVEFFRTELFEQQQLLGIRLGAEQRAGLAVGREIERGLNARRQHVFGARCVSVAVHAVGIGDSALVGFGQAFQGFQRGCGCHRIGGQRVIRRGVCRWRLTDIVERCGVGRCQGHEHRGSQACPA